MNQSELAQCIGDHPFCKGMDDAWITYLAGCAEAKRFQQKDYLMRFQQNAEEFHLLLEGKAVLLNSLPGKALSPFETINAPNVLGWSWLVAPYRWHFDVRAVSDVKSICIHTQCLRGKMTSDSDFGCEMYRRFIEIIVDRLQASRLQAMDIYSKPESASI